MPWILGSFLETPCAWQAVIILISKQDRMIRVRRSKRCVTGRRSRDENHMMRFRESAENLSRARDMHPIRSVSDELARRCKRWHPPDSWKKIWEEEVLALSICLSTPLSHTTETSTISRIKCERYIFINKCVCSFIEVRKWCLIMFPLVYVCGYTTIWFHTQRADGGNTSSSWSPQGNYYTHNDAL